MNAVTPGLATRGNGKVQEPSGTGYAYSALSVVEAVRNAETGAWDVPRFQREFVWKPEQVAALADSLWRNYPVGSLLLWRGRGEQAESGPRLWIGDGQQRLTSLCFLFGREPAWWASRPAERRCQARERFSVFFDPENTARPFVAAGELGDGTPVPPHFVALADLLFIPATGEGCRREIERLAARIKAGGRLHDVDESELYRQLRRVVQIRKRMLLTTVLDHELPDVLEIFQRLNSGGTRFHRLVLRMAMKAIPALLRREPGSDA